MGAVIHGAPGGSLQGGINRTSRPASKIRRGAFFEEQVAQAIHTWLGRRRDTVHVFHDLVDLNNVAGAGLPPISLGESNIDHLILTGRTWLMIDAKGCGAGSLRVERGRGVLFRPDGTKMAQPWMDDGRAYSRAGMPYRLTEGKGGVAIWVVPTATLYGHPSLLAARFLAHKQNANMCVPNTAELAAGALDQLLPELAERADPGDVARLQDHVPRLT